METNVSCSQDSCPILPPGWELILPEEPELPPRVSKQAVTRLAYAFGLTLATLLLIWQV